MLSPYLVASAALTVLGIGLFAYGRKLPSVGVGVAGIMLMAVPYVVFSAWALWGVAGVGVAGAAAWRVGVVGRGREGSAEC